jgi:uroporphyrin-III C-methyltransferase/precorrin-2 dehydrogenase/sirohydrochlorin ferrochelatase
MRYFPVFFDLHGQAVVVVGAGAVAERKMRLLLKAGAKVRVVAKELNRAVQNWHAKGAVEWAGKAYAPDLLDGARLVFAASSDGALNRSVSADAEALGIPVNVVDDRLRCRFITPAVVDRDPVLVAVSSGGTSPVLARRLRAWIEQLLPLGLGKVAAAAGRLRAQVAATLPGDRSRRFWDDLLTRSAILALSARDGQAIEEDMQRSLAARAGAPRTGRVYLVGAGPGRPDLLTVRALQVLGQADVVLHDRLVPGEILGLARRDAEFVDVGKRVGERHDMQRRIHDLLVRYAAQGRQVVRLKGGDPFIFGRGGEELEFLRAQGVDYEVVPGVTAATACAAYAGIPLTHREHSQALTLVTGHTRPDGAAPPWRQLAGPGRTLAVYMAVKRAGRLKNQLLAAGLDGDLAAALVADGTRDSQQVIHGTVNELPAMAARLRRGAPGLFIIGEVSAVGRRLAWFGKPALDRRAA